jgi:DNA replication and repair protein RecF
VLVRALKVAGFRNLQATTFVPSTRFNVIAGENGQGKTNLLEAIYLAGTLRSFRTLHADEMIAWDAERAAVAARVERAGIERVYEIQLAPRRKTVTLDGKTPRTLGEYFGEFNVVLFAPEDLRVPRGSPGGRRRFLDRAVFNRRATYLEDAQRYGRVLRSRNALLREGNPAEALLDAWDDQLVLAAARVVVARRRYLAELEPYFQAAFTAITQTGQEASLRYDADLPAGDDEHAAREALATSLRAARRRDVTRRQTTVGPHVDDLDLLLGGRLARSFASQGQLRAIVLAWKTAEMRLLKDVHGDAPILLLDDVSSELDARRNRYLFDLLDALECQCFVTTTHAGHVPVSKNRHDVQIVGGRMEIP